MDAIVGEFNCSSAVDKISEALANYASESQLLLQLGDTNYFGTAELIEPFTGESVPLKLLLPLQTQTGEQKLQIECEVKFGASETEAATFSAKVVQSELTLEPAAIATAIAQTLDRYINDILVFAGYDEVLFTIPQWLKTDQTYWAVLGAISVALVVVAGTSWL